MKNTTKANVSKHLNSAHSVTQSKLVYAPNFRVFYSSQYKNRPIYWSDNRQDIKLWFDNKQVSPGKPLSLSTGTIQSKVATASIQP